MLTSLFGVPDAMNGLDALHALDDAPLGVVRAELEVAAAEVVDADLGVEHEEEGLLEAEGDTKSLDSMIPLRTNLNLRDKI